MQVFFLKNKLACNVYSSYNCEWICDSGASQHMSENKTLFSNLRDSKKIRRVSIPDGSCFLIKQIREIILSPTITLKNVYYTPDFKLNLISLYKIIKDMGISILLNESQCFFQDPHNKDLIGLGNINNGVYIFDRGAICGATQDIKPRFLICRICAHMRPGGDPPSHIWGVAYFWV